jgi:cardiolipin synthase
MPWDGPSRRIIDPNRLVRASERGLAVERGCSAALRRSHWIGEMLANPGRWIVPNSLSILRIGLALGFPWVERGWRAGVVVAAALSDLFDGKLSRALHGTSTLGQILDPVADKLFVGVVLATLVVGRDLTLWEFPLLAFRDLAVLAGSVWSALRRGWGSLRQMPPSLLGKLATAGQLGFLLLLTLDLDRTNLLFRLIEAVVVAFSILAGIDYIRRKIPFTDDHATAQL